MLNKLINSVKGDKYIWAIVLMLSLFSVLAVYSSTGTLAYKYRSGNTEYYLIKQLFIIGGGLGLMYLTHLINYKYFSRISQILYYLSVVLLVITLFFGTEINDARRWITLPGVNLTFQTSDLAKFALIMYLARMLSKKQEMVSSFKEGFWPTIMPVFIICALIAPADLSSALVLFSTSVLIMFVGRIHIAYIGGLFAISLVAAFMFITLLFTLPKEKMPGRMTTWKSRIESFTNDDVKEEPYQLLPKAWYQEDLEIALKEIFYLTPILILFLPSF